MNRTQKFALNSLTSMVSQIVVMAAGMITPRLMICYIWLRNEWTGEFIKPSLFHT